MRLVSRNETPEARAERLIAELRAATSEAAGVLKDLQHTIKSARSQIDEYLHDECARALNENNDNLLDEVHRITNEHEAKVIARVVQFAALIENNFSREALIVEAANRIEAMVSTRFREHEARTIVPRGGVVIDLCDRPHAD